MLNQSDLVSLQGFGAEMVCDRTHDNSSKTVESTEVEPTEEVH